MSETQIGYHASHEQFPPGELLEYVQRAESKGFECILASDHFHPWSERQGESGHVWAWLGAAMQETSIPFGTVNAPGYRYHPAVIAQAAATLQSLYPEQFWLAIGSGQLLNEGITGKTWPPKNQRNQRLKECAQVMRKLFAGEEVTHRGEITVEQATLYSRPESPPRLIGAALSEETAEWLGTWADGMITLSTPDHESTRARVEAFRAIASDQPIFLKAQLSFAERDTDALDGAVEQWRTNCIPGATTQQLRVPADFDALGDEISPEIVREHVRVSADLDRHREWIQRDIELGADRVILHNVNTNQVEFIHTFGEEILPTLDTSPP